MGLIRVGGGWPNIGIGNKVDPLSDAAPVKPQPAPPQPLITLLEVWDLLGQVLAVVQSNQQTFIKLEAKIMSLDSDVQAATAAINSAVTVMTAASTAITSAVTALQGISVPDADEQALDTAVSGLSTAATGLSTAAAALTGALPSTPPPSS